MSPQPLLLEGERSDARGVIEADLAAAAYERLLALDLAACGGLTLSCDRTGDRRL
ncbi:hypothetical protein [Streptosporangium nondiastaticum]|uniref:hypothetical protein n=1 Tax=Streptosporangium nondiastaticum TaxID=35764 RepID=UPI00167C00CA|nr:hypothetical protein [Streptosporangium nondiastaticum]